MVKDDALPPWPPLGLSRWPVSDGGKEEERRRRVPAVAAAESPPESPRVRRRGG
jgi:hypothetical protein